MSKLAMKSIFNTDDGTVVLVPTKRAPRTVDGNVIKALSKRKRKNIKYKAKRSGYAERVRASKSPLRSPADIVCEAVKSEGFFPFSMGGTNGLPKTFGAFDKK